MLQVYLVRHGETESNVAKCIQGHTDSPLTNIGINQAKLVAKKTKFIGITHIFSSDLGRAKKTAEIIAKYCNCKITIEPKLRELNMGILEGRKVNSLSIEEEFWRQNIVQGNPQIRIPKGETIKEITKRMFSVLEYCRSLPPKSIPLLVSHGISLVALLNYITMNFSNNIYQNIHLSNCSISQINYQKISLLNNKWIIKQTGDISHLI